MTGALRRLLLLFLLAGSLSPLRAQERRSPGWQAPGDRSSDIIARRIAEARAREAKRRAWLGAEREAGAAVVARGAEGAVAEDLRQLARTMGWEERLDEGRIRRLAPLIVAEAARYRLPPALVMGIIHLESEFDPMARSRVGATGLMQVMPGWLSELDHRFGSDLTDPATNLRYGAWVLQNALAEANGDPRGALLRYNGCVGPSASRTCSAYPDRVRERVEAGARRTCAGRGWDACVAAPLARSYPAAAEPAASR